MATACSMAVSWYRDGRPHAVTEGCCGGTVALGVLDGRGAYRASGTAPYRPRLGTNTVSITIRNESAQARDVLIEWQSNSKTPSRGWGLDSTVTIPAFETKTLSHEFIVPAFAGDVTHRFVIRDASDRTVLWRREFLWNFPSETLEPTR